MDEWEPIESAPKDGTFILTYDAGSSYPDDPEECIWLVNWDVDRWRIMLDGQSASPTHWMPLPAPPSPSGAEIRQRILDEVTAMGQMADLERSD